MAEQEKDPGIQGKKLSKSDSEVRLEARNKSYHKVIDTQLAWLESYRKHRNWVYYDCDCKEIIQHDLDQAWCICGILLLKYKAKSAWHEKEFGW
jgi:hypothetical protein